MSTIQIRKKLHRYIDQAQEKKLKAIYASVEDEIEESAHWEDQNFIDELIRRSKSTDPQFSIQESIQPAIKRVRSKRKS